MFTWRDSSDSVAHALSPQHPPPQPQFWACPYSLSPNRDAARWRHGSHAPSLRPRYGEIWRWPYTHVTCLPLPYSGNVWHVTSSNTRDSFWLSPGHLRDASWDFSAVQWSGPSGHCWGPICMPDRGTKILQTVSHAPHPPLQKRKKELLSLLYVFINLKS